jgi:hypothetical protein
MTSIKNIGEKNMLHNKYILLPIIYLLETHYEFDANAENVMKIFDKTDLFLGLLKDNINKDAQERIRETIQRFVAAYAVLNKIHQKSVPVVQYEQEKLLRMKNIQTMLIDNNVPLEFVQPYEKLNF